MPHPAARRRSLPRRLLNWFEVDQAVFYSIVARLWQFAAGPITILLIARYFTEPVQGYYYTFWSLTGLQVFFELGFPQAIINFASLQWSKLELSSTGEIQGDSDSQSKLASLFRAAIFWYSVTSVVLVATILIAGWIMFSADEHSSEVRWQEPWIALSILSGVAFALSPVLMILEGCNQVKQVYQLQFARGILGNLVIWCVIPMGGGLWAPVAVTIVRLLCECILIFGTYRRFFRTLARKPTGAVLRWGRDVWPFQWRIGCRGLFAYFNAMLIGPVVFIYQDAIAAGQVGLVWQVLNAIHGACGSWVRARASRLGMLVAKSDFAELDRVFFRVSVIGAAAMVLACCAMVAGIEALNFFEFELASRFLPSIPSACFAAGLTSVLVTEFQWVYIYAHRKSPYLLLGVANSIVNGLLIWWWGYLGGASGVALAYLLMNVLVNLPLWTFLWLRFRRQYHHELVHTPS